MIEVKDLQNDKLKSKYDYVSYVDERRGRPKPFRAEKRTGPGSRGPNSWRGPRRATALEAAQDYCDYVNSGAIPAAPPLRTSGHVRMPNGRPMRVMPDYIAEAAAKLRAWEAEQKAAEDPQNYVYLIGEAGCADYVKIGESIDPNNRAAGLQTGNPRTLIKLASVSTPIPIKADRIVHAMYAKHHHKDEWFHAHADVLAYFGLTMMEFLTLVSA